MKRRFIITISLVLIIALNIFYFYFLSDFFNNDDWREITIDNGENSIFTDHKPSEIAEKLATSLNIKPLVSKSSKDQACCITEYKFKYQNNTSIIIFVNEKSKSLWSLFDSPIKIYRDLDLGLNVSNDRELVFEKVGNIWENFLKSFKISTMDYTYNITVDNLENTIWKLYVKQTCNDSLPLMNTGFMMKISDNSVMRTMDINKWSKKEIEREFCLDTDGAKNKILEEIPKLNINTTELNLTGFTYFDDSVFFDFQYELIFENNSIYDPGVSIYTVDENGTEIEIPQKKKTIYFYINVENGEFRCNDLGIRKLREEK